jgi:iron complex outermembrane receptor protein
MTAAHATVARGANALTYGASTLGGAINFVSRTGRDSKGVALALNGGSFGQVQSRVTAGTVVDDRFDGLLTVERKEWDGYREHNGQDRLGLYANAGWQVSDSVSTRIYGTWIDNNEELAGSLTRAEMAADRDQAGAGAISGNYQVNVETWRLASKTTWQIDPRRQFDVGFSVEEQSLFHPIVDRVMVDFDGPGPALPVEVFSLLIDTDHRDIGAAARYNHRIGRHDLLFGVNFGRNDVEGGNYRNLGGVPNGRTTLIDNDATSTETFAMDRWRASDRTTLILGLQAVFAERDVRNRDIGTGVLSNPKDDYSAVNPRIGFIYDWRDDVAFYANVSRLFEPPTNYQLQDNVQGGDATLDAMSGTVAEVGTRGDRAFGSGHQWAWDVSIYYAAIDDEILSVEDPAAPGTSLVTNIDATIHAGIEAMLSASFSIGESSGHRIEPLLAFTLNDFEFDDDPAYGKNRLPAAPDYALRGEIMYRSDRGYYAGPTLEFVGERYADFANTYRIDAYTLLGFRGGWSGDRWGIYADVGNILGEEYVSNHSVRNVAGEGDAILNPGAPRSVYAGFRVRF